MQRKVGRVENYTNTCLIMWGVNLFWILVAIWVLWGLPAVLITGLALNTLITRLERRVQRKSQPKSR